VAWAVLQPLSLVVLYWFVFTIMIPRGPGTDGHYIEFLICGLLPWLGLSEGITRSTSSIVENAQMVRKLSFRSELLVIVPNASAMLFEMIALVLFCIVLLVRGESLRGMWAMPLALMLQFLLQLGVGLCLAAVYVFFRDLTQIIGFVLSILFYLSPILYSVPARFADAFAWNPMTPLLGLFRHAMLLAPLPPVGSLVFLLVVASVATTGGLLFFRRAQPSLVDLV
jgi:ABC-type polysaccharide/polyol phosphate export permease